MPWTLVVLGAFSILVFRRARRAGRNPFGWMLILWAAAFGLFIVAAYVGYALMSAGAPFQVIPITALSGMLAGAVLTTWKAGQPASLLSKENPPDAQLGAGQDTAAK